MASSRLQALVAQLQPQQQQQQQQQHCDHQCGNLPRAAATAASVARSPALDEAALTTPTTPMLTAADHAHWLEEGWLHVRQVVPTSLIEAMQREVWQLLDADPQRPESMYNRPDGSFNPSRDQPGCHLLLFATQAQYDVMTHPRTYQLFRELWATDELWCSATGGGVLMKPPANTAIALPEGEELTDGNGDATGWGAPHRLHWDINPHELRDGGRLRPDGRRGRIQASLAVVDAPANAGSSCFVPRYHHRAQRAELLLPSRRSRCLAAAGFRPWS